MYYMSKMSRPSTAFINKALSSAANRKQSFCIAMAYILSRKLSLPAEAVEDLSAYYRLQVSIGVDDALSRLNECIPFDTKLTRCLTEQFYTYRYSAVHPAAIPLAMVEGRGLEDFFGLSRIFGQDTLACIDEGSGELTAMVNGLSGVLSDIETIRKDINAYPANSEEQDVYVA